MAKQLSRREIDLIIWCLDEQMDRFDLVAAAARFELGNTPIHYTALERLREKLVRMRDWESSMRPGHPPGA